MHDAVKRKRERQDGRKTLQLPEGVHALLREAADRENVQVASLASHLILCGLKGVESEGRPLSAAS